MRLLSQVVAALESEGVPCALIGAAALAAAGVARSTFDFDLLTTAPAVLSEPFWAALRQTGVTVDIRRGDDLDPLAGVIRVESAGERPVDVIVGRHAWQRTAVLRARRAGAGPPIVTPTDLVLLKLFAGGTQDFWDIRQLLAAPGGPDLSRDVEAALASLPTSMRRAWAEARR